ncbi:uncharacterized protein TNCV_3812901 [Trichonephila clavipes]|nr:uncharacterized protein TNCV_3812901 [Trichonephila clavipes]
MPNSPSKKILKCSIGETFGDQAGQGRVASRAARLKRRRRLVGVKGSTRNGHRDSKRPSPRRLRMVREYTRVPIEGTTCACMATDEAVGCTPAFPTMWWSSQRLVYRGRSETGLRVNEISRIHWSQHLLSTQSEWPN